MLKFFVPGEPHGKGRPRATRGGRMFTPAKTVAYEGLVAYAAKQEMGERAPLDGPLKVDIQAVHSIPASWSKRKKSESSGGPATCKPDIDNIVKSIADGGNGVLWVDDKQIASLSAAKRYGESPGVWVTVEVLANASPG
jgi:Holliday junction resolvase RusA-like endonuclease